jgi:hypothetical protein
MNHRARIDPANTSVPVWKIICVSATELQLAKAIALSDSCDVAATVTYGFTGTVTSTVGGIYSGTSMVGDSVTGTFSINTDNVDPSAPNSTGIVRSHNV